MTATDPSQLVATVLADPAFKAHIEDAVLRALASGVPGTVLTAGASLVPGIGPIVALLEPIIRSAIMDAMAAHAPAAAAAVTPVIAPVTGQLTDLLSVVNGLRTQIEALVLPPPQVTP